MNKEKRDEFKNKIKKYTPAAIIIITSTVAGAAACIAYSKKVGIPITLYELDDVLPLIDRETQMELMNDENFSLFKITDDEYMFTRPAE